MSPELQKILDQLDIQLDSMSPEEYEIQSTLINQMNDGPTAEEIIRSFHDTHKNLL